MKKIVLSFLTSIAAIWFIDLVLSGFVFAGSPMTVFYVVLFMLIGNYFTSWLGTNIKGNSVVILFIVGVIVNFFTLYIASLILTNFNITAGSLNWLNLKLIKAMDKILMLMIGAIISSTVAAVTRWASSSKAQ